MRHDNELKVRSIVREELKGHPNLSENYIVDEVLDFHEPFADESYQSREDVTKVISSCLTKLGIKNEVSFEPNVYTIKRFEV